MSMDWEFNLNFGELTGELEARYPIALARGGEHLRGESAKLTPVLTGHLVGSGGVTVEGLECTVSYKGPYARYQHYGLGFKHTHGQALFLEQPVVTEAQTIINIVADTLGEAL